jgi:hypothetical protein
MAETVPANDDCEAAVNIELGTTVAVDISGASVKTNAALGTCGLIQDSCVAGKGLWFTVTGTGKTKLKKSI